MANKCSISFGNSHVLIRLFWCCQATARCSCNSCTHITWINVLGDILKLCAMVSGVALFFSQDMLPKHASVWACRRNFRRHCKTAALTCKLICRGLCAAVTPRSGRSGSPAKIPSWPEQTPVVKTSDAASEERGPYWFTKTSGMVAEHSELTYNLSFLHCSQRTLLNQAGVKARIWIFFFLRPLKR